MICLIIDVVISYFTEPRYFVWIVHGLHGFLIFYQYSKQSCFNIVRNKFYLLSKDNNSHKNLMEEIKPYRSTRIRFFLLFLVSFVVFGNQYAFNNPQALQQNIENDLDISQTQFELLYTIFAFPNIFATFIIGFLIDYLGVRIGIMTLSGGVVFFQFIIAIGGYAQNYTTILIARMLFGLASQSLITAQVSMVSFWFKGKQLALAIGIAISFPQLGNAANSYLTPLIYEKTGSLGTSFLVSVFICLLSFGAALGAAYLDKKADKIDEENHVHVIEQGQQEGSETQAVKLADLKRLKWPFWLIICFSTFATSLYVPFLDNANSLFIHRFCFTNVTAGRALVVTYVVAASMAVPLGLIIDKVGHKRYFIIGCMGIYTFAQLYILVYPQCSEGQSNGAIVGLAFIGLGYCFYGSCIVPSIPLVVKKKITGTAFGIMQMIESFTLAFFPLITGAIVDGATNQETGYRYSSLFFTMVGVLSLFCCVGLFYLPEKVKNKLDKQSMDKVVKELKGEEILFTATENESSDGEVPSQKKLTQQPNEDNLKISLLDDQQKRQLEQLL